jgi:fibronectin-binding autotransporter adhesin
MATAYWISKDAKEVGVQIGVLEGDGSVSLGPFNLTVGPENPNPTFSGVISDGDNGGSLTKVGAGTFTLAGR